MVACLAWLLCSCASTELYPPAEFYYTQSKRIEVRVFYEAGAEPFTQNAEQSYSYWNILEDNMRALMQFRSAPPDLYVPRFLEQMQGLGTFNRETWTAKDIINLGRALESDPGEDGAFFYILFLKGKLSVDGKVQDTILGANISGTPFLAIFKDVIVSSTVIVNSPVLPYIEQSTLVHEMGHAMGLVNLGVPLASNHQDMANGAHTIDENCVMYHSNESRSSTRNFIENFIGTETIILWGEYILRDVEAISQ